MVRTRIVFAIVVMSGLLRAQTIRVETREVPVDVSVSSKNGQPVSGLSAKDFSVWEDGRPQKINSVTGASDDPETVLKHFVLYFDFSSMPLGDQIVSEREAAGFVTAMASPDRYMAVMMLRTGGARVLQDFTPARAVLERAVNAPISTFQRQGNAAEANPQQKELADSLVAAAAAMAPAPGRKAVLLFTNGYGAGNRDAFRAAITACNRANVALFVITGSEPIPDLPSTLSGPLAPKPGTVPLSDDLSAGTASFAHLLAEGTGGEALTLSVSLKDQLAGIARGQDEAYRVFYTPPASKDGVCHTLRVTVDAHRADVRARNEYCTEKQVDVVAGKIDGESLEKQASNAGSGSFAVTMQAPYFYTGTNRAVVHLSAEFVPAGMKFAGLHGQIDVVGTAVRADGDTAARFADSKSVDVANQAGADAFVKSPYHYEQEFTVAAGSYDFQLAIGAGSGAVGKISAPLRVEPWNAASFGMGSVAFSTDTRTVDSASLAAPSLEGAQMTAGGKLFVPSALNRFQKGEAVYFYTEIYDPGLGSGDSALSMEYRILDARSGEVKVDSGVGSASGYERPGNPVVPFATRLPLGQLVSGQYRLEVVALGSGSDRASRVVGFAVE